jgi:hypothetical protein
MGKREKKKQFVGADGQVPQELPEEKIEIGEEQEKPKEGIGKGEKQEERRRKRSKSIFGELFRSHRGGVSRSYIVSKI